MAKKRMVRLKHDITQQHVFQWGSSRTMFRAGELVPVIDASNLPDDSDIKLWIDDPKRTAWAGGYGVGLRPDDYEDVHGTNPGVRQIGRHVYDYDSANRFLDGKNSRKLAHNTLVHRDRPGDAIRVRYHNTDVVTYHLGGSIELNSGGYQTVTTKQRMNQLLPPGHGVYQHRHEWFVQTPNGSYPFEDGATLYPGSSMEYETPEESSVRFREGRHG